MPQLASEDSRDSFPLQTEGGTGNGVNVFLQDIHCRSSARVDDDRPSSIPAGCSAILRLSGAAKDVARTYSPDIYIYIYICLEGTHKICFVIFSLPARTAGLPRNASLKPCVIFPKKKTQKTIYLNCTEKTIYTINRQQNVCPPRKRKQASMSRLTI